MGSRGRENGCGGTDFGMGRVAESVTEVTVRHNANQHNALPDLDFPY